MSEIESPTGPSKTAQGYGVRILTSMEAAWLGGVIDGEGSIYISKVKAKGKRGFIYAPYLSVSNSNHELIAKVREIIGRGYVGRKPEKRSDWNDGFEYKGSGSALRGILPQILPYLIVKKKVATRILEFLDLVETESPDGLEAFRPGYNEKLNSLYWRVKELNKKGSDLPEAELLLAAAPFNPNHRKPGNRTRNCRKLTKDECAWLAGVIDGEGSIFLSKVYDIAYRRGFYYRPQFIVTNSNKDFLIAITKVIGEGTVHRTKKGGTRAKTRWDYIASAGVLRAILPQVVAYAIVKRERARKMLGYFEFIDTNTLWGVKIVDPRYYDKLDSLYSELKQLNKKGKRPTA